MLVRDLRRVTSRLDRNPAGYATGRTNPRGVHPNEREAYHCAGRALRAVCRSLALRSLLLAACGVLPKREPNSIYEPPARVRAADRRLAAGELVAAGGQAGRQPAARQRPHRGAARSGRDQVYKGAAWTEPAPDLVQTALLRRFEDSGKILSVARPGGGVRGEYQLQTDLRAFESVYTAGAPQAQIEIYARLVHTADGEVVGRAQLPRNRSRGRRRVGAVVDAFSRGARTAPREQIAGWTLPAGNAAPGARRSAEASLP